MKPRTRYFTHATGFGDNTAYVVISAKRPYLVSMDGKRGTYIEPSQYKDELEWALRAAKDGVWKEITAAQAKALVKP